MNSELIKDATDRQRDAANTRDNVFVSANAGSGKTRVLVDRVSRLLLSGVPPAKILCLTYTKAAAGEMQDRLFAKLGEWSILPDDELQAQLANLDGDARPRTPSGLTAARRLFARALETPEGLKVQTIHAFCERLLRRFPIEAGIAPGYEALDDTERAAILADIKIQIGEQALDAPQSELAKAISYLAGIYANAKLDAVYARGAAKNYDIADWEAIGTGPLADFLGVDEGDTPEGLKRKAWADLPRASVKSAADELAQSGKRNKSYANLLYEALAHPDPASAFDTYKTLFLKQDGTLKVDVVDSKIADELFGSSKRSYGTEALRVEHICMQLSCLEILRETSCILTVSSAAAKLYRAEKRARRKMDFDDQIRLVRDLLSRREASEWILYKLDGGVDHVLIDEAQDTGPDQWDIIDRLSAEFTAVEDSGRTKFAVGDEKQSIYGFQGARPDLFLSRFQELSLQDAKARSVSLSMSFRSAPQILEFVDTVFADCGAVQEIFDAPPAGDIPRHTASRTDQGRVELWPLTKAPEKTEGETAWDMTPVDAPSAAGSREQLAFNIAAHIKGELLAGTQIFDRDSREMRPVRPGDIMILVRKRSGFFDAVIRHLKLAGVAVAGADKLTLTSNIGVQDLISLGKFVALTSDDLSLAEVLKSPIFGLDDNDLIFLTGGRGRKTLWEQINTITLPPHLIEARGTLRKILKFAPDLAPYEFYARVLSTLMVAPDGSAPDSILKRLYSRLGIEAADPIEAFLGKALAHQRAGPPSPDKFLREMDGDGSELKREPDARADEVRVMTVHGAKGLEAPVVILPDTSQLPTGGQGLKLNPVPGGGWVVQPSKAEEPDVLAPLSEARKLADYQEYLRQLYVALTRAESRLIICGFQSGGPNSKIAEGSWYDWASRAFAHLGQAAQPIKSDLYEEPVLAFGPSVTGAAASADIIDTLPIPAWAQSSAPAPRADTRYVTPSHLLAGPAHSAPALKSPLHIAELAAGPNPFARGIAIHKLLEILPDIETSRREKIARDWLSAQSGIEPDMAARIFEEVFAVLDNEDFADLFAPGSRAEVSLAGGASHLPAGVYINAQIDRLAVTRTEVWIVDYKSNRPPPKDPEDVAQIYIAQMAAYRALAQDIYPKKTVRCALLWTDEPRLMELPAAMLDSFDLRGATALPPGT